MDSPVTLVIKELIQIDKSNTTAVYIQLAQQLINAIQRGYLAPGTKLPGTRVLAQILQIHRNTAVAVYDELASQGWVEIKANQGTFIIISKPNLIKIKGNSLQQFNSYAKTTGFPLQSSLLLASTVETSQAKFSLNDGQPDLRLHPTHQFSKWYSAAMKRKSLPKKWNTNILQYSAYEAQLCNYLNASRGFHIQPHNLLSTRSTEMNLYVVSQILLQPNDLVLVGNWSNYATNMIFQQSGAKIKTIPTDEKGLNVDFIERNFTKNSVRCVYVCANRDYPTTKSLSAERRLQLLELAQVYNFAIIEDDYDYDFQFEGLAMLPMASSDANGLVIYLGKLGQSLFPSFQTGFVVAPENLIIEAKNYLQLLDKQGDLIQEQVLAELISEGEIHRLLKKNVLVYKKRLDFLCDCLHLYFSNTVKWEKPAGGLAIWLQFEPKISLLQLARETEKNDLFLPKTILYQNKNTCAIRFGFGHLTEEEIEIVVKKLKMAYDRIVL
ncbi:PLP-dependent aminotransferase family protein [Flavobacterium sp.]|uniref:aminotransferase-like domain-containing protein n=1 Tax=Flavobacterium sp. TaxID=239 RepID=UPI0035298FF5